MRTADRVYEEIRREILSGRLQPGERITEELMAERFGASRTPIRSAMVRLESDGFVETTPRSGTTVKQRSPRDIADIYDVRALLESAAAGLAAQTRSAADLRELVRVQTEMEECFARHPSSGGGEIEDLSRLNKAFHHRILEASGNTTLADSAVRLMDIGFLINTYASFSQEEIARSLDEHRKLIVAIETRDVHWAEAMMRAHILGARNSLRP
ncbi:GntR family transcriptional regulator [Fulvimarina endophytica]|uniref:GntR family transcriptional regulator n=1 Tax=Fulvimarina endophytica TaxID=2293836 RepID=A0A371X1Q6_9HYPH|nr:GntR family transcriptional regulator [Fulvimarina endophytica]